MRRYSQVWRYLPNDTYFLVAPDKEGWADRAWGPARNEQEARYLVGRKTLDGTKDTADQLNNRIKHIQRLI